MDTAVQKRIVISAVNIRKGGTLTVLRECLAYLSGRADLRVTAIVHKRSLCAFPGIEYIEIPWSIKGWSRRLWCEYVTLNRISRRFPEPVDLWLSLHDTTPRVKARRQAVYCHTSFPFMKATLRDFRMDYKIALFSKFTRFAYQVNVRRNAFLVVQQQWLREALSRLIGYGKEHIIVAPPSFRVPEPAGTPAESPVPLFLYPATPDCHKNFETLCEASRLLENAVGKGRFRTVLTLRGDENRYARWLHGRFKDLSSVEFHGFMNREELSRYYGRAACLVFPSRIETWGLPISEFKPTGKPMLLADLPYAHETAGGSGQVAFFPPTDAQALARAMAAVLDGAPASLGPVPEVSPAAPYAPSWESLFDLLLTPSV